MEFVVDASMAATWILPDEQATATDAVMDRLDRDKCRAPSLFWHEMRNLLLGAERRSRLPPGRRERVHAAIARAGDFEPWRGQRRGDLSDGSEAFSVGLRCELSLARPRKWSCTGNGRSPPRRRRDRRGPLDLGTARRAVNGFSASRFFTGRGSGRGWGLRGASRLPLRKEAGEGTSSVIRICPNGQSAFRSTGRSVQYRSP